MSSTAKNGHEDGGGFTDENDLVTARGIETRAASIGRSKPEALARIAEAPALHESSGMPIDDEAEFLHQIGIDPNEVDEDELPPPSLEYWEMVSTDRIPQATYRSIAEQW